jgi:hypothetical protein
VGHAAEAETERLSAVEEGRVRGERPVLTAGGAEHDVPVERGQQLVGAGAEFATDRVDDVR